MAEKETNKTKEAAVTAKVERVEGENLPGTAMAVDAEGEVRPLGEIMAEVKPKKDEVVVLDNDAKPVARPATAAELGEDTAKEDPIKFIPPVVPSNAPQPASYIGGIRTGTLEEDAEDVLKIAKAMSPTEEEPKTETKAKK